MMNVINNLARMMTREPQKISNAKWELTFLNTNNEELKYSLHIKDDEVISEKIIINGDTFVFRNNDKKEIKDAATGKMKTYTPPQNIILYLVMDSFQQDVHHPKTFPSFAHGIYLI